MIRTCLILVLIVGVFSCTKTTNSNTNQDSSYAGKWLWIGTSSGPFRSNPLVDSPVVLSINSGNLYIVTLNGQISAQGNFTTNSGSNGPVTTFNNITAPSGNSTSGTVGNVTFISFNYIQVGRFFLYQNNLLSISGDTLTMLRYPITPETPVSLFVRTTQ
jgi:hypothetical protein